MVLSSHGPIQILLRSGASCLICLFCEYNQYNNLKGEAHWCHVALIVVSAKEKCHPQVKTIIDRIWERFASTSENQELGVQDLYCAILLVYK